MKATEEASFDFERDGPVDSPSERRLSSCTSLHVKFLSAGERDAFAPLGLILGVCFWFFAIVSILKSERLSELLPRVTGHPHLNRSTIRFGTSTSLLRQQLLPLSPCARLKFTLAASRSPWIFRLDKPLATGHG